MQCDRCGEREAAIHLTQIVDNSVTTLHLCAQCAAEKGIQSDASVAKFPLSDFLASMGQVAGAEFAPGDAAQACDFCGGTIKEFRETGRLGCPQCYDTFESHLRDLLRRLHGSSHHTGEVYLAPAPAGAAAKRHQLSDMRQQLRAAVDAENFELAAEIRDRIRALE
ncbi:MAG: UvrB/UvrC motif-containing protein [Gemmatimonadales bacterium]